MQDKVLFGLLAIAACATAASISGTAAVDPRRIFVGGQLTFPRIPGINTPLFGYRRPSNSSATSNTAGRLPFPVIPGVNYPLFGYRPTTTSSTNNNNNSNNNSSPTPNPNNSASTSSDPNNNSSTTPSSNNSASTSNGPNSSTTTSSNNSASTSNGPNSSTTTSSNNSASTSSDPNSSTTPSSNNSASPSSDPNNSSSTTSNPNSSSTSSDPNSSSSTTSSSDNSASTSNDPNSNSSTTPSSKDSSKKSASRLGPFGSILSHIPVLNRLVPGSSSSLPTFPNVNDLISRIPGINNRNGNGTSGITVPTIKLPSMNDGPYIPGVSEALNEARTHVMASLNITTDLSTGIRDVLQTALDSDNPAASIGIIMNTIAKVYSTVAANCPLIVVGTRVVNEGIRLAYEVARSVGNVAVGSDNNIMP